jgi:large conductance mechanosensitive channel
MQDVVKEFKQFLMRGNVIDLAVAVVMGAAFGAVINSLVNDLIMPIIAMIFGKPDFSSLTFTINDAVFRYGAFITALITFVLTAAAIFFFVVKPINMLMARRRTEPPADPSTMKCPFCLSEVPIGATRCAFCTSELAAQAA